MYVLRKDIAQMVVQCIVVLNRMIRNVIIEDKYNKFCNLHIDIFFNFLIMAITYGLEGFVRFMLNDGVVLVLINWFYTYKIETTLNNGRLSYIIKILKPLK